MIMEERHEGDDDESDCETEMSFEEDENDSGTASEESGEGGRMLNSGCAGG